MTAPPTIEALAMIVRHARQRHDRAVEGIDRAKAEEAAASKEVDEAEHELQQAVDALVEGSSPP